MSNFFKNSDLDNIKAESIVSDTLNNCDDGELYLENSKSESILLDDNKIKNSSYSSDLGYGFRAITGEVVAYSHSNDISKDSILKSSENLKDTLKSKKGTYNHEIPKSNKKFYKDINPIEQKTLDSKLEVLNKVNEFLRKKDGSVKQVTASFAGEQKSIEIILPLIFLCDKLHTKTALLFLTFFIFFKINFIAFRNPPFFFANLAE